MHDEHSSWDLANVQLVEVAMSLDATVANGEVRISPFIAGTLEYPAPALELRDAATEDRYALLGRVLLLGVHAGNAADLLPKEVERVLRVRPERLAAMLARLRRFHRTSH
jgi:hypothetical protein